MPTELKEKYPFSVDSWTTLAKRKRHHFLTHAHSDHTGGIESFADRSIYCSDMTRRLALRRFPKLHASRFIILEIGESKLVQDDEEPFTVMALDANHCPGAVMLIFEGDFGNVLHTGDCRLTEECLRNVLVKYRAQQTPFDCVFLDCTFGKEHLKMPSRSEASVQVRQCILDHPQVPIVYLASDMLGLEELWSDLAGYFNTKIYVDKQALPEYYADMKIVVPELVTDDPHSTRFHICEGSPYLFHRAKIKFMHAHTRQLPEPLFIRPSAQYYTFEERLEGAGCGMILDGDFRRSSRHRRHLRVPKAAERDEHGIWHVCYSIHSCRSELEKAMEILWPKEVISTSPHCHASEVMSKRADLHHVDISSRDIRILEIRQGIKLGDAVKNHNVRFSCRVLNSPPRLEASRRLDREIVSSPRSRRARKKACLEEKPDKYCVEQKLDKACCAEEFAIVPLFGIARHDIPPSPPLSFDSMDSPKTHVTGDSQNSVDCLLNSSCKACPEQLQEEYRSGRCSTGTLLESSPGDRQEEYLLGSSEVLVDRPHLRVLETPTAIPDKDATGTLGRHNTPSSKETAHVHCNNSQTDKVAEKENVGLQMTLSERNFAPRRLDHRRGMDGFNESTRRLYRSFLVSIPPDLPSLLDLYRSS